MDNTVSKKCDTCRDIYYVDPSVDVCGKCGDMLVELSVADYDDVMVEFGFAVN